jgi:hypothetical protein
MSFLRFTCPLLLCCSLAGVRAANDAVPPPVAAVPPPARSIVTVIELTSPWAGLPGVSRERAHHALSLATDAPKPLLRSFGLDVSECALRLRLPSRLSPSRESAAGLRLDVQAQAGLGCKF